MALKRLNLISARMEAGLSQEALSEKVEATRQTIGYWENGLTEPYPYSKGKLKELFGVDLSILLRVFEVPDEAPELMKVTAVTTTMQQFIVTSPTRRFWQVAHTDYQTPLDMTTAIQAAIKDLYTMTTGNITRREALCELASIPMIAIGTHQTLKSSRHEEMLKYCTAALEGCWGLYRGSDPSGAQHAFECCSTYVPLLESIAHDSSQFRKEALELAAQYAIVKTMLGWSCMGAKETIGTALHALSLSRESGNILLCLSAHSKLNWTYTQSGNSVAAHNTMLEGEHALREYQNRKKGPVIPVGAIANFYSGYALTQADNGIDPDKALGMATDSEVLEGTIAGMRFSRGDQAWEAARVCSGKGDAGRAMTWLNKIIDPETLATRAGDLRLGERGRIGAMNTLTDALLQAKERDMEHVIRVWSTAIERAKALKSEQRYRDAMANFAVMKALWRNEQTIKSLLPMTSHW